MLKVEPRARRAYRVAMRRSRLAALGLLALAATTAGARSRAAAPTPASAATLAAMDARGREMLELAAVAFRFDDAKFRGYDTVAFAALHGCDAVKAQGMATLLDPALLKKSSDPVALAFALPPLVRYMRLYPQCLTPAQVRLIRSFLTDRLPIFTHGTINHALMTATSFYLLAQMLPDQTWHEGTGVALTSAQLISRYRALLLARFAGTMAHGHNEQLSTTYALADLFPLFNLIDFAKDPVLCRAAEVVAIAQIAMLRADAADGFVLPPYSRESIGNLQAGRWPRTNAADILWYYYGTGRRPPHVPAVPAYLAMLTTVRWRPPAALLALQSPADVPYEVHTVTPIFSEWAKSAAPELYGSALIGRDFAIGSGEVASDPQDERNLAVAFAIQPRGSEGGPVECTPDGPARASPRQQAWRRGAEGALLYAGVGAVRCGTGPGADEVVRRDDLYAVRFGRVAVVLRFPGARLRLGPMGAKGEREVLVPGPRVALGYDVAVLAAGERLADHADRVAARPLAFDPATGRLAYRTRDDRRVTIDIARPVPIAGRMASRARVTLDGTRMTASSPDYFDSPILKVGSGRFALRSSAGTLTGSVIGETATLGR